MCKSALLEHFIREINNVQVFFDKVYSTIWNEVSVISMSSRFLDETGWELADEAELNFHLEALVQCFVAFTRLRSFGVVNSRGFERLWEKLEHLNSHHSAAMLDEPKLKLSTVQFSCQTELLYNLGRLRRSITKIAQILSCKSFTSQRCLILHGFAPKSCFMVGSIDDFHLKIRDDNPAALKKAFRDLEVTSGVEKWRYQELLSALIQLSIIYGSGACLKILLQMLRSFQSDEEFTQVYLSSAINKIIIRIGHQRTFTKSLDRISSCFPERIVPVLGDKMLPLLIDIVSTFQANIQTSLFTQDTMCKSTTFHYVAQYGLQDVCQLLLGHMQDGEAHRRLSFAESILLEDHFGNNPLSVALSYGFEEVSRGFIEFLRHNGGHDSHIWRSVSRSLLAVTVSGTNPNSEFLRYLSAVKSDVNHQGFAGETGLYMAASYGDTELVECLLDLGASTAVAEKANGWTPLIAASVEGHMDIVEILLQAGASLGHKDHRGWTALDHAAFRGHIRLSRTLRQPVSPGTAYYTPSNLEASPTASRKIPIVTSQCLILVNLGSFDSKKSVDPTSRSPYHFNDESIAESEAELSIQISLIGSQGPAYTVELPILEDMTNKPWAFYTNDLGNAILMFKINRKSVTADKLERYEHIGSAVALVDNLKQALGSTRESLIRDYTIPILSMGSHENIGALAFSFLVVKPFTQPNFSLPARDTLLKNGGRTKIVGHRGILPLPIVGNMC